MAEHWSTTLVTAAIAEPVTIDEARRQARYEEDDENDRFANLIEGARRLYERQNNRQLVTATWDLILDRFPMAGLPIYLPWSPLASVTSVGYVDSNGDSQTLTVTTEYVVDTDSEPGRITEAYGETWPNTRAQKNVVTIRYVAGYGDPVDVPLTIKQGILARVVDWFENPEKIQPELEAIDRIVEIV